MYRLDLKYRVPCHFHSDDISKKSFYIPKNSVDMCRLSVVVFIIVLYRYDIVVCVKIILDVLHAQSNL